MLRLVLLLFGSFRAALHSRGHLVIENLALRQQLALLAHTGRRGRVTGPIGFLGDVAKAAGEMVRRARLREARDSDAMGSSWLPQVLDVALAASAHRSAFDQLWSTRIDPALGC